MSYRVLHLHIDQMGGLINALGVKSMRKELRGCIKKKNGMTYWIIHRGSLMLKVRHFYSIGVLNTVHKCDNNSLML